MIAEKEVLFKIALTLIKGIGPVHAKTLMAYCGSAEAIFSAKNSSLLKIPGIGPKTVESLNNSQVLQEAEKNLDFTLENNIQVLFINDTGYPEKLRHCNDAPLLLFKKGAADLNQQKSIAIVGTRNATEYGKEITLKLIEEISAYNPLILSGLAYGIDKAAHKAAVDNNLATVGVLAHGLDNVYPSAHRSLAKKMIDKGALLTEFPIDTIPDRPNFPARNRIVAGMCDAVVVVESDINGGALITAEMAYGYHRDVFSIPGKVGSRYSRGCHKMIKTNMAALLESGEDLAYQMGWIHEDNNQKSVKSQKSLFIELNEMETLIVETIGDDDGMTLDKLCLKAELSHSEVVSHMLNLELKGVLKSLPGNRYKNI